MSFFLELPSVCSCFFVISNDLKKVTHLNPTIVQIINQLLMLIDGPPIQKEDGSSLKLTSALPSKDTCETATGKSKKE